MMNHKKWGMGILLGALTSIAAAQNPQPADTSFLNAHYNQRLAFFEKMPDRKGEIVFVGNSLTEAGKWSEILSSKKVINRGISGDVTYGILARLNEILASRPSKIFLLCGINDMKRGIPNATILGNIRKIVNTIRSGSPQTKIYIQSLLPVNESMLPAAYAQINNNKIDALNNLLKALCEETKANYVNLHPALEDSNGQLKKELSIDGLHLKQSAYLLWGRELKKQKLVQ